MVERIAQILLVEDNPADVRLIREALKQSVIKHELFVVGNGLEALDFLQTQGIYKGQTKPDLILLDLNLPKKSGREVLIEIKNHTKFKSIPVIILTSSALLDDILKSYDQHANCYIIKPTGLDEFERMIRNIEKFWFEVAKLPPR